MTSPMPSAESLAEFEKDLNEIRDETLAKVGEADAKYIRKVVMVQRVLDLGGRAVMVGGFYHWAFLVLGVAMLGIAKIINNMEIGHNIMHGQYDFMNDPHLNSLSYDWDGACSGGSWRRTHNFEHHTYTNVIGKDRDFGYDVLRLSDDVEWKPLYRMQFLRYLNMTLLFQWAVAFHELHGYILRNMRNKAEGKEVTDNSALRNEFYAKSLKVLFRDYLFFPGLVALFLGMPMFWMIFFGNMAANVIRNVWAATIIYCGHFTGNVHTFAEEECEGESRGQWYYRQILGSSNFEGPWLLHFMSGHLSRQVEHHVFPDLPSYRYNDVAKKVRAVCAKHNVPYNTGSFVGQYFSVLGRIFKYSRKPKYQSQTTAAA